MNPLWYLENNTSPNDCIGIDEVGRGPLAGPVVAAAAWISEEGIAALEKSNIIVRDSKKLSAKQRRTVMDWLSKQDPSIVKYATAQASVEEIDTLNILNAALLAMKRAHEALNLKKPLTLVDGNRTPELKDTQVKTIVKGDDTVISIALASIIAKESRDNLMKELSQKFPQYGWNTNVGYGSQQHIQAIVQYGVTEHHRKTFSPIKDLEGANKKISEVLSTLAKFADSELKAANSSTKESLKDANNKVKK